MVLFMSDVFEILSQVAIHRFSASFKLSKHITAMVDM